MLSNLFEKVAGLIARLSPFAAAVPPPSANWLLHQHQAAASGGWSLKRRREENEEEDEEEEPRKKPRFDLLEALPPMPSVRAMRRKARAKRKREEEEERDGDGDVAMGDAPAAPARPSKRIKFVSNNRAGPDGRFSAATHIAYFPDDIPITDYAQYHAEEEHELSAFEDGANHFDRHPHTPTRPILRRRFHPYTRPPTTRRGVEDYTEYNMSLETRQSPSTRLLALFHTRDVEDYQLLASPTEGTIDPSPGPLPGDAAKNSSPKSIPSEEGYLMRDTRIAFENLSCSVSTGSFRQRLDAALSESAKKKRTSDTSSTGQLQEQKKTKDTSARKRTEDTSSPITTSRQQPQQQKTTEDTSARKRTEDTSSTITPGRPQPGTQKRTEDTSAVIASIEAPTTSTSAATSSKTGVRRASATPVREHETRSRTRRSQTPLLALGETTETAAATRTIVAPIPAELDAEVDSLLAKRDGAAAVGRSGVTRRDLETLLPTGQQRSGPAGWLNDEIVNSYIQILVDSKLKQFGYEKTTGKAPPFHAFNTHLYPTYGKSGFDSVNRWWKRAQISGAKLLETERVFIPVNDRAHWTLLVVSGTERTIKYYDSMAGHGNAQEYLTNAMKMVSQVLGADAWKEDEWTLINDTSAQQSNGSDCGAFACANALASLKGVAPATAFIPTDIPHIRRMVAATLVLGSPLTQD